MTTTRTPAVGVPVVPFLAPWSGRDERLHGQYHPVRMEAARLAQVTLRAGTVFRVVEGGRLSAPRVLEADAEVEVRRLAAQPGEVRVYAMVMVVDPRDEAL